MNPLEFLRTLFRAGITGSLEHRTRLVNYHLEHILYDRIGELMRLINGKVVYDIGAHSGAWSRGIAKACKNRWAFYLFEANESLRSTLESVGEEVFIAVLSDSVKEVDFYFSKRTGDSYYKENSARYRETQSIKVKTTTLDILSNLHSLPQPDLIKIDTQGSEIDILKGGPVAMSHAMLLYIEIPLAQFNDSAPRVEDYFSFIADRGFLPLEIGELHWMNGAVVQLDVLFVRKGLESSL
jgi:FkbM family methyltransferase